MLHPLREGEPDEPEAEAMSMRPWWIEHDETAAPPEHKFAFPEAFSPAMRALLGDVEEEFESLGGGALAWQTPLRP